jgi:hypothetical protein
MDMTGPLVGQKFSFVTKVTNRIVDPLTVVMRPKLVDAGSTVGLLNVSRFVALICH